jgi:hypothetical protein
MDAGRLRDRLLTRLPYIASAPGPNPLRLPGGCDISHYASKGLINHSISAFEVERQNMR